MIWALVAALRRGAELRASRAALDELLDSHISGGCEMLATADLRAMIAEAREPTAPAKSEACGYWSEWFEWRGGPCPLPPRADVQCEYRDGSDGAAFAAHFGWKHHDNHADIIRFRYASRDRLGWLDFDPEKWPPPAELFDDACPVKLEWAVDVGHEFVTGFNRRADWGGVHYVRLVARREG